MNDETKKRLTRTGVWCLIALVVGAAWGWNETNRRGSAVRDISPMAGVSIGGPFALINQDGQTVTDQDFAGQYRLVFFGFTACPMICPTELAKITEALNALGPKAENVRPVFITVDPARDTPEVMKKYLANFHPRLVGLTGTKEQIEEVEKSYRVYAAKEATDDGDYTMSHSGFTYFMGPEGELLSIFKTQDTAAAMSEEIKGKI